MLTRQKTRAAEAAIAGAVFVLLFAAVFDAAPARAIPAFSREYEVPCQTCHFTIPRRNEFGDVFRLNGYHWPGAVERDRAARKDPPIGIKGIALFDGFLPKNLPLALSASFSASYSDDPDLEHPVTLGPPELKILLGGALFEHLGFFGTWNVKSAPSELYLHFTHLFSRPELNIRLGRFEQTTTLFKTNEALIAPYLIGSSNLEGFAVSSGRLGAELNGILFGRLFYALGVVDQNDLAAEAHGYYHLRAKFGGMDLLGREPDVDLEEPTIFDDFVITLAHWGYRGGIRDNNDQRTAFVRRFGFESTITFRDVTLQGGAMLGFDVDLADHRNNHSLTWFGEVSYSPVSWLVLLYTFQFQDASSFVRETKNHDFGALILLLEDVRLRLRGSLTDDGRKNEVAEATLSFAF